MRKQCNDEIYKDLEPSTSLGAIKLSLGADASGAFDAWLIIG